MFALVKDANSMLHRGMQKYKVGGVDGGKGDIRLSVPFIGYFS